MRMWIWLSLAMWLLTAGIAFAAEKSCADWIAEGPEIENALGQKLERMLLDRQRMVHSSSLLDEIIPSDWETYGAAFDFVVKVMVPQASATLDELSSTAKAHDIAIPYVSNWNVSQDSYESRRPEVDNYADAIRALVARYTPFYFARVGDSLNHFSDLLTKFRVDRIRYRAKDTEYANASFPFDGVFRDLFTHGLERWAAKWIAGPSSELNDEYVRFFHWVFAHYPYEYYQLELLRRAPDEVLQNLLGTDEYRPFFEKYFLSKQATCINCKRDEALFARLVGAMHSRIAAKASDTDEARARRATAEKVDRIFRRPLSEAVYRLVHRSYQIGNGEVGLDGGPAGVGNYTAEQLARKVRLLVRNDFLIWDAARLMAGNVVKYFFADHFDRGLNDGYTSPANPTRAEVKTEVERLLGREIGSREEEGFANFYYVTNHRRGRDGTAARFGNYTHLQVQSLDSILTQSGFSEEEIITLLPAVALGADSLFSQIFLIEYQHAIASSVRHQFAVIFASQTAHLTVDLFEAQNARRAGE